MGFTYYRHMVMIPEDVELDFNQVYELIKEKFARDKGITVNRVDANRIQVQRDYWSYYLYWAEEPHVIIESQEIADFTEGRDDNSRIASSAKRIEGHASPDPDMNYFDEYTFILAALETIAGLYHFDTNGGQFWKAGEEYWKKKDDSKPSE